MRHGIWYIVLAGVAFATAASSASGPTTSAVILSELLNDHAPYRSSHASTIAETTDGQLVAARFGGTADGHPDVGIWFARRGAHEW
jgi:predicted neuraminidase